MGIFDFRKKPQKSTAAEKSAAPKKSVAKKSTAVLAEKKEELAVKNPSLKTEKAKIKGKTAQAHQVLIKPLVTERAADLGVLNQYVFMVDPRMNKIEVKKAVRTIYDVEPVKVNISNMRGKNIRYGRTRGTTKNWKKAIVTLKPGDKIEIYEGV